MYNHLIGKGFKRWDSGTYTPGQIALMNDFSSPSILYSGSYRAGKTEICARKAIKHCLLFEGAKFGVFRAKLKSLRNSTLVTVLELVPPHLVADWNNSDLTLRFFNGSQLSFLGCDFSDRIGSIELTGAFIDESHEASRESYGMIVGRMSGELTANPDYLERVGLLDQLDYAQGSAQTRQTILACNPKSRGHWLYQEFINPPTRLPGRAYYSSNTLTNTNLPPSYVEQNLLQYAKPGVSEEEIVSIARKVRAGELNPDGSDILPLLTPFGQRNLLGLWVSMEGAIYGHVSQDEARPWAGKARRYYAGVDFGFHHPRVVVLAEDTIGVLRTVGYWFGTAAEPDDLLQGIVALDGRFPLKAIFFPHDQPGIIQKARRVLGGKVRKANTSVLSGIGTVQTALNRRRVQLGVDMENPEATALFFDEMGGYSWMRNSGGDWLDTPEKVDDHFPDALRYVVHTLVTTKQWSLEPKKETHPGWDEFGLGWN